MQPLLNYKQKTNFLSMLPTNMDEEGSPKIRSATAAGGNLIQDAKACSMLSCLELPTDWEEDLCVSRKCTLQRYSLLCWVPKWVFWLRHPCRECQLRRDILLKVLEGLSTSYLGVHSAVICITSCVLFSRPVWAALSCWWPQTEAHGWSPRLQPWLWPPAITVLTGLPSMGLVAPQELCSPQAALLGRTGPSPGWLRDSTVSAGFSRPRAGSTGPSLGFYRARDLLLFGFADEKIVVKI